MIDEKQLESWEQICKDATPGPYKTCGASNGECQCGLIWCIPGDDAFVRVMQETLGYRYTNEQFQANKRYVAMALSEFPALLKEIQKLKNAMNPLDD